MSAGCLKVPPESPVLAMGTTTFAATGSPRSAYGARHAQTEGCAAQGPGGLEREGTKASAIST